MIFIQKYKNNNQHSSGFGKYYGRVKIVETVGIEKIAQRMQDNCTVKTSDVMAVLNELGPTITQLLQESKRVRIPSLGCFKIGACTKGEADEAQFNVTDNVKSLHLIFQPETETTDNHKRVKKMLKGATLGLTDVIFGQKKKEEEPEEDPGD